MIRADMIKGKPAGIRVSWRCASCETMASLPYSHRKAALVTGRSACFKTDSPRKLPSNAGPASLCVYYCIAAAGAARGTISKLGRSEVALETLALNRARSGTKLSLRLRLVNR